jgi:hypothetical protein
MSAIKKMTEMSVRPISIMNIGMLLLLFALASPKGFAQTVTPSKHDYEPGEAVILNGSGWAPNEVIDLQIWRMPATPDTTKYTVEADASGNFSSNIFTTTQSDYGVRFTVCADGRTNNKRTWSVFNDAGGDFNIDFVASEPFSYDHETGGGIFDDRTIGTDVVESLEGGDFECGDVVTYLAQIVVEDNPADNFAQTIHLDFSFLANTTGQAGAAHGEIIDVYINEPGVVEDLYGNTTDPGHIENGNSSIENVIWSYTTTPELFQNSSEILLNFDVTGLEAGEKVVVRIDTRLECEPGSTPTGNLQAKFSGAETSPDGDAVPQGAQTIPFKQFGSIPDPLECSLAGDNSVCEDEIITYTVAPQSDGDTEVEYVWTVTGGATIISGGGLNDLSVTVQAGTQDYLIHLMTNSTIVETGQKVNRGYVECEIPVTVNLKPDLALSSTPADCAGQSGTVTLNITNGNLIQSYAWTGPNGTYDTQNLTDVGPGIYNVTVTDVNGCVESGQVEVGQDGAIIISEVVTNASCFGVSDGSVTLSVDV